jgi:hypothetical protein
MEDSDLNGRLKTLLAKRGDELVEGCIDELGILHQELAVLRREISALSDYQSSRGLALIPDGAGGPLLPKSVTIEADQMLRPHDGFYHVEYTAEGMPFRWTGPSVQFSFSVFVDRSAGADVSLLALTSIDFELQKKMTLVADGETVPVAVVPEPSGFAITAFLPARADRGVTSLVFVLPAVLSPPGGADARQLGIAFARLSVKARRGDLADGGISDRIAAQ